MDIMNTVEVEKINKLAKDNIELLRIIKQNKKKIPLCTKPWTSIEERSISGDLKPCCWFNFTLGKALNGQDLIDIWFGKKMIGIRKQMLRGKTDSICWRYCPVLRRQFNFYKQEFYDYSEAELKSFDYKFLVNRKKVMEAIIQAKARVDFFPIRLKLHPTNNCNLKCTMCQRNKKLIVPKKWYFSGTFEKMKVYLEELKVFGGEPFSCALTKSIIFDKNLGRQIHHSFISNGTLLNKQIFERLSAMRIGWMDISLDSCIKKTYEAIREGAKYTKTISNLKKLIVLRNAHSINRFDIYADFVVQKLNVSEIPDFVYFCSPLGILPNFSFVSPLVYDARFLDTAEESINKGIQKATEVESDFALKSLNSLKKRLDEFRDSL